MEIGIRIGIGIGIGIEVASGRPYRLVTCRHLSRCGEVRNWLQCRREPSKLSLTQKSKMLLDISGSNVSNSLVGKETQWQNKWCIHSVRVLSHSAHCKRGV